jgi:hypothetical protein
LIEEHGLLSRVLRYKTDESETEAVTALAETIAHCNTFEEFQATRPSLRWKHLVSAVQAAAISHGRLQEVYDNARGVIHF